MNGTISVLLQELCLACNILVCFLVPIGGVLICKRIHKGQKLWLTFGVGALTFFLSQICLRIPILQSLLPNMTWYRVLQTNIWEYALFLGITAGMVEEFGRLFFMILLEKQKKLSKTMTSGVAFGLGHGGIEAILLVGIRNLGLMFVYGTGNPIPIQEGYADILSAGFERIFAIAFHVGASLLVLYGIRCGKSLLFTIWAVLLHTILDTGSLILANVFGFRIWSIELILAIYGVTVLALGLWMFRKKENYYGKDEKK